MSNLDHLVSSARASSLDWNEDRSARVLGSALDRRERRVARARIVRRALVVGSAAAMVGLLFLRGASASPSSSSSSSSPSASEIDPSSTAVAAAATFGDAGYARD